MASSCTCLPSDGFHQYHCSVSRRMRAELREAGKPKVVPDPAERARIVRPSCGFLRHDWDDGQDPGGACCTYTIRYTCRKCGKTKDRGGA